MATVMQTLPRDDVALAEREWNTVLDGKRVVGMSGFLKVPEAQVPKFEALSGVGGIFVRCIARHRSPNEGPPPPIRWIPRRADESSQAYLERVIEMRESGVTKGIVRRKGEGAFLGLVGHAGRADEDEATATWR
eukprot:10612758-Alexandrium_andersonii.AAC.1